jgi:hypothetical protein
MTSYVESHPRSLQHVGARIEGPTVLDVTSSGSVVTVFDEISALTLPRITALKGHRKNCAVWCTSDLSSYPLQAKISDLPEDAIAVTANLRSIPFGLAFTPDVHPMLPEWAFANSEAVGIAARQRLFAKVEAAGKLPLNWDGEDGRAPSIEARRATKRFIRKLRDIELPQICLPIGDGEIILQWRNSGNFIEVAFDGETISWYARTGNREPIFGDDPLGDETLQDPRVIEAIRKISSP